MEQTNLEFVMNGKRWLYKRERLPEDRDGDCDPPHKKGKSIRVDDRLTGELELYVIIHEARHAENHSMFAEEYVETICRDLTSLLWRIGYRKLTPGAT